LYPAPALTAVVTLGLGIGATTAIFSIVDGVLLRPLPWREPERLVSVYVVITDFLTGAVRDSTALSWPNVRDVRDHTRAFEAVGAWTGLTTVVGGDTAQFAEALRVSSGLLPMLGVRPRAGRSFTVEEDDVLSDSVMISFEAWQRRFGADGNIIGRRVVLDDVPRTIVGVLPPEFAAQFGDENRMWTTPPEFLIPFGTMLPNDRSERNLRYRVMARLRREASLAEAAGQVSSILDRGEGRDRRTSRVASLLDDQLGRSRTPLFLLLAASMLVLFIACANVAGLLLGDAGSRRHEVAVRQALGAGRLQVVRQLLVECGVLAFAGGALGVATAWWIVPGLTSLAPARLPRLDTVSVDVRVLAFAAIVSALTIIVFGIGPSLAGSSVQPAHALRDAGSTGRFRARTQRLIVVGEVALAIVLLSGAALLAETLFRLASQPVGFDPRKLLALDVRPPRETADNAARRAQLETSLLDRIRAVPGVESAAATMWAPFGGGYGFNTIGVEGRPGERLRARRHVVTEDYFETMGMSVVRGRAFERADAAWQQPTQPPPDGDLIESPGVAIVSEELERRYFEGAAVGRRMVFGRTWLTIVGVVPDVKMGQYSEEATPEFYVFARQMPWLVVGQIVVRASGDPSALIPAVRRAVADVNNRSAITMIRSMDDSMSVTVANERYRAVLSSAFGVAALLLASIGLFGLLSRTVSERRREFGVRMAVGARRVDLVRLVLGEGGLLVLGGLLLGVPAALGATSVIRSQLEGVQPADPHTFVLVSAVLGATALAAMLGPAVRASRVDPMSTLRTS
jgi:predicted permease